MMLISSLGEPVVSPLTESVQLRVYARDPQTVKFGTPGDQDFYEARLVPEQLFKGTGGLRAAVTAANPPASNLTFARSSFAVLGPRLSCTNCHSGAGVYSLNTYTHLGGARPSSPWFDRSEVSLENKFILDWKKRDYTWGLLSALLDSR